MRLFPLASGAFGAPPDAIDSAMVPLGAPFPLSAGFFDLLGGSALLNTISFTADFSSSVRSWLISAILRKSASCAREKIMQMSG
jgi:hypothetical protein